VNLAPFMDCADQLIGRAFCELDKRRHESRWHATYNAALNGLIAGSGEYRLAAYDADGLAKEHANKIHGALQ
jgi:hypothetical protein